MDLFLYALRGGVSKNHVNFSWQSREAFILSNNLLLVVSAAAILIGTLYPLFYEVVSAGAKISVGPPYFNAVFVPLMAVLFLFMMFSPFSKWGNTKLGLVLSENRWSIPAVILGVVITSFFSGRMFSFTACC